MDPSFLRSTGEEDFAVEMHKLHDHIKEWLQNNNAKYKCRADQHIRELQVEVGDHVLTQLRKERLPRGTYKKLKLKNIEPCKNLIKFGTNAYELEIPEDVGISPIFNIFCLYP